MRTRSGKITRPCLAVVLATMLLLPAEARSSPVTEYKIDATIVSLDVANSVLTYVARTIPGTQTGHLGSNALASAVKLKPGDNVVLHCHAEPSAQAATVIDEVKKKTSHWKGNTLIVFGVIMVIGIVGLATAPCNQTSCLI